MEADILSIADGAPVNADKKKNIQVSKKDTAVLFIVSVLVQARNRQI